MDRPGIIAANRKRATRETSKIVSRQDAKAQRQQTLVNITRDNVRSLFLDRWHPFAWIALLGLALYGHTVFFGFTYLDDIHLVERNGEFLGSLSNIPRAFTENAFAVQNNSRSYYRPMLFVSFMFDAQVGGVVPYVYHLHNTLLHIATASLVLLFLRHLGFSPILSFLMVVLYTTHPVLTQTVVWIPGRCDLLLAVFSLISVMCFMRLVETGRKILYFGHLGSLSLAFFTKESAFFVVLLCASYALLVSPANGQDWRKSPTLRERFPGANRKCLWIEWSVITLFWLAMRLSVLGALSAQTSFSNVFGSIVSTIPGIVQFYGKLVFPFNLSVFPFQEDTSSLLGVLAILLTVAFLIFSPGSRRLIMIWGLLWFVFFVASMFFSSVSRSTGDLRLLENRLNLPLVGVLIVWMETGIVKWLHCNEKFGLSAWVVIFLVFSVCTLVHTRDFQDPLSFWKSAVRTSPHSPFAHKNLGTIHAMAGNFEAAEMEYHRVLSLNPNEILAHQNLGAMYWEQGRLAEAEDEFLTEIRLHPGRPQCYQSLARLLRDQGRLNEAEMWLRKAPASPRPWQSSVPVEEPL